MLGYKKNLLTKIKMENNHYRKESFMRPSSYLCLFFLLSFFSFTFNVNAQKGYQPGYVITLEGDTLKGHVKDRAYEPTGKLYKSIRFKSDDFFFKKRFKPNKIKGYGYENTNFVSLPLREESVFFNTKYTLDPSADRQFLIVAERNEKLNYYEKEFLLDDNFLLSSFPLFHRPQRSEMVRVTQGMLGPKQKLLRKYFADCPAILKELDNKKSKLKTALDVYNFYLQNCDL